MKNGVTDTQGTRLVWNRGYKKKACIEVASTYGFVCVLNASGCFVASSGEPLAGFGVKSEGNQRFQK